MAIYTYECTKCEHISEYICTIAEHKTVQKCTACGEEAKQVILAAPNVCIAPKHRADQSVLKYHGITNPVTGEGLSNKKYY